MILAHRRFSHHAGVAAALGCVALITVMVSGHGALSQAPRTIKIVVPFPPGGPTDTVARLLGEEIGRMRGSTVIVENRPGASTAIGTDAVARAEPDGGTLLMAAPSFVINPQLKKLNYDPLTSFAPICNLASSPVLVTVGSASPYRSFAELIAAARAKPGDVTLAINGTGSSMQLAAEMIIRSAKVDLTLVPFPGTAAEITALMGGHVKSAFADYMAAAAQIKAGNVRVLAVAGLKRFEPLPDVPTVVELGYDTFEADAWFGVVAPANTPKETLAQLGTWFSAAIQAPAVAPKLIGQGLYPVATCGAAFGAYLRKQYDEYGRIIREANIKAE
jgi:tripartite-type tricarboxylate transporter receptor subunit TctC